MGFTKEQLNNWRRRSLVSASQYGKTRQLERVNQSFSSKIDLAEERTKKQKSKKTETEVKKAE